MKLLQKVSMSFFYVLFLALTACNTVEGVGEDVQRGGERLEDAAQKRNRN